MIWPVISEKNGSKLSYFLESKQKIWNIPDHAKIWWPIWPKLRRDYKITRTKRTHWKADSPTHLAAVLYLWATRHRLGRISPCNWREFIRFTCTNFAVTICTFNVEFTKHQRSLKEYFFKVIFLLWAKIPRGRASFKTSVHFPLYKTHCWSLLGTEAALSTQAVHTGPLTSLFENIRMK